MKLLPWDTKIWQKKVWYSKKILFNGQDSWYPWSLVQEIKIMPGEIAQSHYHKIQTEIFYFLNDCGYWIVNWKTIQPKVWDVLLIEPDDRHIVVNDSKQDYFYLAFKVDYVLDDSYWE